MIKHAYSACGACHADPSGGELLTGYGRIQSDLLLRMRYGKPGGADTEGRLVRPRLARLSPELPRPSAELRTDAASGADDDDDDDAGGETKATSEAKADAPKEGDAASEAKPAEAKPAEATAETEAPTASAEAAPADDEFDEDGYPRYSRFLWGVFKTPEWLLLGGSYRHLTVFRPSRDEKKVITFPMMADVYGQMQFGNFKVNGSIGAVRVGVGSPYARAAQVTGGQGDQWNLLSRTHWVGYDFAQGTFTLRAGHMNLPFGVRIPEHTMWVRQATRTDRESAQQDGVALSYNAEPIRGELMLIAGNYQVNPDKYRERGYSLYVEYLAGARTALGVSSLVTSAKKDRITLDPKALRQAHGAFVRSVLADSVVLLAEANALITTDHDPGYVGFAQVDFEVTQGLHLMATGEVQDRGYDKLVGGPRVAGNGQLQTGAWGTVDWFCLPHVELRADAFSRQNDEFTVLGQLHVFL